MGYPSSNLPQKEGCARGEGQESAVEMLSLLHEKKQATVDMVAASPSKQYMGMG